MTPETARAIQERPVDADLYQQMQLIYKTYTVEQIAAVIARVRADIVLAEIDHLKE